MLVTPQELKSWKESGKKYQLIDIREPYEVSVCSMGGYCIPMEALSDRIEEVRKDIPVIIHCQSGNRSNAVVFWLESKYALGNVYSLEGGIVAWNEMMEAIDK